MLWPLSRHIGAFVRAGFLLIICIGAVLSPDTVSPAFEPVPGASSVSGECIGRRTLRLFRLPARVFFGDFVACGWNFDSHSRMDGMGIPDVVIGGKGGSSRAEFLREP